MLNLNENTFAETIDNGLTLVDFYTPWCGPCRVFQPVFEQMSMSTAGVKFAKVDLADEDTNSLGTKYRVDAVPTVILFKNGEIEKKWRGAPSVKELESAIEKAKSVEGF